jgi:hypothetical protein
MNDQLRALFVDDAPDGWLPMLEATLASASPARRCCSVSSAANSAPSTSAKDAAKASESSPQHPNSLF